MELNKYRYPLFMLTSSRLRNSFPESPPEKSRLFWVSNACSIRNNYDSCSESLLQPAIPGLQGLNSPSSDLPGTRSPRVRGFHLVERLVRGVQQGSDGPGILRETSYPDAHGKRGFLGIFRKKITNSPCHQRGGHPVCLGQDQRKLVPAVSRRRVYGSAAVFQYLPQAAEGSVTRQMAKVIVDFFQFIQIQQEKREITPGAFGTAYLGLQDFEQPPMVGQPGQGIAVCLVAEMIFQSSLLGDVDSNDFVTREITVFVKGAAASQSHL